MSHQRPRSRPSAASRLTNREVGRGTGFPHATAAILGFLLLATVFLGACNQEGREEPTPEPVPTNTAAPLPVTAAPTALPPAATFTATAAASETASPHISAHSRSHRHSHCHGNSCNCCGAVSQHRSSDGPRGYERAPRAGHRPGKDRRRHRRTRVCHNRQESRGRLVADRL